MKEGSLLDTFVQVKQELLHLCRNNDKGLYPRLYMYMVSIEHFNFADNELRAVQFIIASVKGFDSIPSNDPKGHVFL